MSAVIDAIAGACHIAHDCSPASKVFMKLGTGARSELDRVLPGDPSGAPMASS